MGTWGTIKLKHFHPNTHECYGIFQGSSELVFGEGTSDPKGSGITCNVKAGDVVVVPAGVAHASTPEAKEDTEAEYRYIGVYPEDSPHYRSELGKKDLKEKAGLIEEVAAVPVPPQDPLYGRSGPLVKIWKSATGNSVE
ncbi:Uncharacterized protein C8035_v006477 [Colletotrichum spinosum]|uniref:Cupin type-1 domain-containing protein n=1 Tax=Colletotrichum spinosum TaxID=1347390 RepID=A0A4R8QR93_9PEZI|nr:Uncharacterized protein C8035_v006477 [Colletotrichum spinosum]